MTAVEATTNTTTYPNWPHVSAFLGLNFGLTYLLDLAIYLNGGLAKPGMINMLQFQMLLPAFSAILLGLFFFPESPIYFRKPAGAGRWYYYYFIVLTLFYAASDLAIWLSPTQSTLASVAPIAQIFAFVGLLVLIGLRLIAKREGMARVGLSWGNWRYWLIFGLGIVAYYALQAALNAVTGLGTNSLAPLPAVPGMAPNTVLILGAVQSVLLAPVLAISIAFGEEYGWRGYLQGELFKLGRVRGVLLLGVIWGAWHWPLILMGYNYPSQPLLGLLLMALYTTGLAIVLGYAVLRTGSVLLSSFLHALNNQVVAFFIAVGFRPHDTAFSFDIGVFGILTLAIVCALILRDPIWREEKRRKVPDAVENPA